MSYNFNKLLIGKNWVEAQTGEQIDVIDPSTGRVIGAIPRGTSADVDSAISAARQAAEGEWGTMSMADRGRLLTRFAIRLEENLEELAQLESLDVGKPIGLARREIGTLIRNFEFYGGAADKLHGEIIPTNKGLYALLLREPLGVTGHIIPWNGPASVFGRTVAASLAAGNACVVKPAEDACISILRIAQLMQEAGFPAGALNIVTGYGFEAGAALSAHAGIDHISFTGSPLVGTQIQQSAAMNHVPVVLELGGKSPNIVFDDADLEAAADSITRGVIINSGQVCAAGTRVLVQKGAYERLLGLLHDRFAALRAGPPSEDLDLGPLISRKQADRVSAYVAMAENDKLKVAATGQLTASAASGGFYQRPLLLRDVDPAHALAQEEIFGPVLVAIPFDDEAQAVRIANGTPYGLIAGVWTRDGARQFRMISALRAGQVFVNSFLTGPGVELPFGGSGKSGHGREKGFEALRGLTKTKTAVIATA